MQCDMISAIPGRFAANLRHNLPCILLGLRAAMIDSQE